jgi:hypothetical protein
MRLEQIESLAVDSFDVPRGTAQVKLGCEVCTNAVCIVARGVDERFRSVDKDTNDLTEVVDMVAKSTIVRYGFTTGWDEKCAHICELQEDIETAVGMINERFNSEIRTGA